LKLGDYCITEAGFGADLGSEKFFDIKCRAAGLAPSAVVLVSTIRSAKYNGGVKKDELTVENIEALEKGLVNLGKHIENIHKYGLPVVVAVNRFGSDTDTELAMVKTYCQDKGASCILTEVFAKGREGGIALAKEVVRLAESGEAAFKPLYEIKLPLKEKINIVVKEIYGGKSVSFDSNALSSLKAIEKMGYGKLPVCMAKTQYSLSDDPAKLGRPENFTVKVREVRLSAGAGFVVAVTGKIMTMPGLPKIPAAEMIDVDENGDITGIF
jgi:formate--tetrahydrofolate ligase